MAVEIKQGISQLELLFQEFSREDRLKQKRKQARKLKKRRKKERKNAVTVCNSGHEDDEEVSLITCAEYLQVRIIRIIFHLMVALRPKFSLKESSNLDLKKKKKMMSSIFSFVKMYFTLQQSLISDFQEFF